MRSMGRRARWMISGANSTRGESRAMQSRSFSIVFIFMNLHWLQWHGSVGARMGSCVGAQMKCFPGHSFRIR